MHKVSAILALTMFAGAAALAADASAGKAVYDHSCKTCHGPDGTANPTIAKMMKVEIKDLKSPDVQSMSDGDLKKIITAGKGKMQPVRSVAAKDLDNLVAYVHSLKK